MLIGVHAHRMVLACRGRECGYPVRMWIPRYPGEIPVPLTEAVWIERRAEREWMGIRSRGVGGLLFAAYVVDHVR